MYFLELQIQNSEENYWGYKAAIMWVITSNPDEHIYSLLVLPARTVKF